MNWAYRFDERALKELRKLDQQAQRDIIAYLDERIRNRRKENGSGGRCSGSC